MNKLPPYALLLAALLGLSQCRHDPAPAPAPPTALSQLPPETQTGQRTFGCLINGQAWNLAGSPLGGPLLTTQYYSGHLNLSASGLTTDGKSSGGVIQIDIDNVVTVGRYTLIRKDTTSLNYNDVKAKCAYYTDKAHPGTVEITRLDLVNRIVSGRFSCTLETPGCGQLVVTDGRFDSRF